MFRIEFKGEILLQTTKYSFPVTLVPCDLQHYAISFAGYCIIICCTEMAFYITNYVLFVILACSYWILLCPRLLTVQFENKCTATSYIASSTIHTYKLHMHEIKHVIVGMIKDFSHYLVIILDYTLLGQPIDDSFRSLSIIV